MGAVARSGRVLTLAAIATALAIGVFLHRQSTFPSILLIITICIHLYFGSKWARWTIGVLLLVAGIGWSYRFLVSQPASLHPLVLATAALAVASLVSAAVLIFSKKVPVFLKHQRLHEPAWASGAMRVLWIIIILWAGTLVVMDLYRVSGP